MINNPQVGSECWMVHKAGKMLYSVPVVIVAVEPDGRMVCRWLVDTGETEDFRSLRPENLYATRDAMQAAIRRRLRKL